jgi:signal transduction histidine kinase
VRFKYRLGPRDSEWREVGAQRFAFFQNLRPGDYTFQVKAANHHGLWNEVGTSFSFSIAPHFYETWLFYGLSCGVLLGIATGVQAYRLRVQRRILKLEQTQAVHEERARIAQDLHDELGSRLTALAVRTELAGRNPNGSAGEKFRALATESRALAERMREVIWTADPECDSLEALAARLSEHAEEFLAAAGIRLRLDFPETFPAMPVSAEARQQLTMIAKEALHNVFKHARASEVRLKLQLSDGELLLSVCDNGVGFDAVRPNGRGLVNMRTRVERLGGALHIHSSRESGTVVEARVPSSGFTQPVSSR